MKKVLFLSVLSLLLLSVFSCKDDDDNKNGGNLAIESKRLTLEANGNQSLFDPVKFVLNIPIGATIEDSKYGSNVTYKLDSTAFFHRNDTGAVQRVAGDLSITHSDTLIFKPKTRLFLNEEYYLYVYCSYYSADGKNRVVENGSNVTIARWAKYVPTVVPKKDVLFSSTMNGVASDVINPYNGDLIVDFEVPVVFSDSLSATKDIALLYRKMTITSNSGDEYVVWDRSIDTISGKFTYVPQFPADRANMIAGVYYTVNLQFDYLVNEDGKWVSMMNSYGDTATWNYNKAFKTDDLFVPKNIVTDAFPTGGSVEIDTIPTFNISESHLKNVTKNGITFRNKLVNIAMSDGVRDYLNYKWLKKGESTDATADSVVIKVGLDSLLLPTTNYKVHLEAQWQFLKDTTWYDILEEDTIKREIFDIAFKTKNPAPTKSTFVKMNPISGAVDVSMNASIFTKFSSPIGSTIVSKGIEMRSNIQSFSVLNGTTVVGDKYVISDDKQQVDIILDSLLTPITEYKAIVLAYWEYKDINNTWKRVTKDAGKLYVEGDTVTFKTFNVPSAVVKQVTPTGSRIDLNSEFGVKLVGNTNNAIVKEGVEFRPVFLENEVSIKRDGVAIEGTGTLVGDSVYTFVPDSMLYANSSYLVSLKSYWEFKDGDHWRAVKDNGVIRYENVAKIIKTVVSPGSVITSILPNRAGTALDDSIAIIFRSNIDSVVSYGGTEYKLVANNPVVVYNNGADSLIGQQIVRGKDSKVFIPDTYFNTGTTYTTKVSGEWMYKRNGKWFGLGLETKSASFTALSVPTSVLSALYPTNKSYVDVTAVPTLTLAGDEFVESNNIKFKRVVDSFKLLQGTVVVDSTYNLVNNVATLNLTSALTPSTPYTLKATAHWEYQLKNGTWVIATAGNILYEENLVVGFNTNAN